jgi:glycosyltransferase involved in cell wall biosynthesis
LEKKKSLLKNKVGLENGLRFKIMTDFLQVHLVAYNQVNFIEKAILSVLKQKTSFPFKLIIGDDGSNDGTQDIILKYQKSNPEVIEYRFNKVNKGSRNPDRIGMKLLRDSHSKYITLLDGDDYWTDPNKLQFQVDFMENNPECFIITHVLPSAKPGTQEGWYDMRKLYQHYYLPHASNFLFRKFDMEKYKAPLLKIPGVETCLLYIGATEGLVFHSSKQVSVYRKSATGIHTTLGKQKRILAEINQNRLLFKYFKLNRQLYLRRVVSNYKRAKKHGLKVKVRLRYYTIIEKIYGYYLAGMIRIKSFF